MTGDAVNAGTIVSETLALTSLESLMQNFASLENRMDEKSMAILTKKSAGSGSTGIGDIARANLAVRKVEKQLEENAALLAAYSVKEYLIEAGKNIAARIKQNNDGMANWEQNLVLDAGYTYSRNRIHRNATTGASLFAVHYSTQEVHPYQDFEATVPVVSVDVDGLTGLGANAVMLALNQIKGELADFEKSIFGEQIETKGQTKEEKQELEKKKKRFEELQAIGYNNLNVKRQDEYNQLAAALYTTEGGRFAEHTGKAPVWIDNRDPSRSRNHNIKVAGSGEIGEIMLDFEWNDMKEKQGWAEVALPMWEKKLWNSSSAPTLRAVADVASNIASAVVAAVPGGAAVAPFVALTDDLLMAGLDYGLGYKDGMDVSKELGRKAAVTAISTYTGAKFAGMSNQVLQTATISSINTTASTAVYSTNFTDFKNSILTYSTWNSTVTSTIGAGVTAALGKIDLRDGNAHNLAGNTFDTKNIAAFNSKVGDLTAAALDYKLTGSTTFNVLDVADLGLSVINKRAKEDGSGGFIDSITGEKTTKKIGVHKGILELTIGGDNSGLHLGSGGYNISYGTIASTVAGLTEAAKVADWKYSSIEKSSTLNSINMLSYTTAGDNQTLAKEIWGGEKKVEYIDTSAGVQGTQNSKDTIYISNTLLGGKKEGAGQRASILSHENVHIKEHKENKGYDEFQARLAGYETYADLQQGFGLTGAGYENVTDIAYMTDYYKQYGQEGVFTKLFFGDAFAKENKENDFEKICICNCSLYNINNLSLL